MNTHVKQLILCGLILSGIAFAQSRLDTVFTELDLNRDGTILEDEFVRACQALSFNSFDADRDGFMAAGEWLVLETAPGAHAQYLRFDTDKDNKVSLAEFSAWQGSVKRWRAVFATLDIDGDKRLLKSDFSSR